MRDSYNTTEIRGPACSQKEVEQAGRRYQVNWRSDRVLMKGGYIQNIERETASHRLFVNVLLSSPRIFDTSSWTYSRSSS